MRHQRGGQAGTDTAKAGSGTAARAAAEVAGKAPPLESTAMSEQGRASTLSTTAALLRISHPTNLSECYFDAATLRVCEHAQDETITSD